MATPFLDRSVRLTRRFLSVARHEGPVRALRKSAGKVKRRFFAPPAGPESSQPTDTFETLPWLRKPHHPEDDPNAFQILVVGHDASRTGAPIILLELARELAKRGNCQVRFILHRSGEILDDFVEVAPTLNIDDMEALGISRDAAPALIAPLFRQYMKHGVALCNTVATSPYFHPFEVYNIPVMAWIHELPTSINRIFGGSWVMDQVKSAARQIISPSNFVREKLMRNYDVPADQIRAMYYGIPYPADLNQKDAARKKIREQLGLAADTKLVVGCGMIHLRKGPDLFYQAARKAHAAGLTDVRFIWVGGCWDDTLKTWLEHDAGVGLPDDYIQFLGSSENPGEYFLASDLFLLTSREDPFPLVNMEALSNGLPVIGFKDGGGAVEVLEGAGAVVPYADVTAMADATVELLSDSTKLANASKKAREVSEEYLGWSHFADKMCNVLRGHYGYVTDKTNLTVSVIVPNYNHANYLEERLRSIFQQTRLPMEVIVLDDASSDGSVLVVNRLREESPVPIRLIVNEDNSGSPFRQWLKGIQLASGDLVWIAESDDTCQPELLERIVPTFADPEVNLSYCQSAAIGSHGELLRPDNLASTDDISKSRWRSWYTATADAEVDLALISRNTIPNASAVLFRRTISLDLSEQLIDYRFAGDWFFYAMAMRGGKISFVPESLNSHRHHENSVTKRVVKEAGHAEETLRVKAFLAETFDISADAITRGVALSAWEHHYLGEQFELNRPSMMERLDLRVNLDRLKAAYQEKASASHPDGMSVLFVISDGETSFTEATLDRINALAKRNRVFLAVAQPGAEGLTKLKTLSSDVELFEGSLEESHWYRAGLSHRVAVLRDLTSFHNIDVIHSHGWAASKLIFELTKQVDLPWLMHWHDENDQAIRLRAEKEQHMKTEGDPLLNGAWGTFYESEKSLHFQSSTDASLHTIVPSKEAEASVVSFSNARTTSTEQICEAYENIYRDCLSTITTKPHKKTNQRRMSA